MNCFGFFHSKIKNESSTKTHLKSTYTAEFRIGVFFFLSFSSTNKAVSFYEEAFIEF